MDRCIGAFPTDLVDVDGEPLNITDLCRTNLTIVCTIKFISCPVCPEAICRALSLQIFEPTGAVLLVLCPGDSTSLRAIRTYIASRVPLGSTKFIADVDGTLAQTLKLDFGHPGAMLPCWFEVNSEGNVGWKDLGRGPGNYGEDRVYEFISARLKRANDWIVSFRRIIESAVILVQPHVGHCSYSQTVLSQEELLNIFRMVAPGLSCVRSSAAAEGLQPLPELLDVRDDSDVRALVMASMSCHEWHQTAAGHVVSIAKELLTGTESQTWPTSSPGSDTVRTTNILTLESRARSLDGVLTVLAAMDLKGQVRCADPARQSRAFIKEWDSTVKSFGLLMQLTMFVLVCSFVLLTAFQASSAARNTCFGLLVCVASVCLTSKIGILQ